MLGRNLIILDFGPCFYHQTDQISYQSAALPPLAASAQTWKPKTANMNTLLATIAAAASAQIHLGSALLVFSIQQLELEHGSQYHFALQEDVAARVSGGKEIVKMCFSLILEIFFFPQALLPQQTIPTTILITWSGRR